MIIKKEVKMTPFNMKRMLHIYLPMDYKTSNEDYPVLYMFDGHNLFYDEDATYGASWKMKEYLDFVEAKIIVVGIECNHEGTKRLDEFCPFDVEHLHFGKINGQGDLTLDWMVNELKPMIDDEFRTLPDRLNTGIGGSSMGGLMAMYGVAKYNHFFSKAACLSSAISFCFKEISSAVELCEIDKETKVYLDWGSNESRNKQALTYATSRNLEIAHLFDVKGASVYPKIVINGAHNEQTWESLVPVFMKYLFNM